MSTQVLLYDQYRKQRLNPVSPAVSGTLTMALVTAAYTPNQNTHQYFSDVTGQVTGSNYTPGGNVLAAVTCTMDAAGLVTVDATDPAAWLQHASGFSNARRAVMYFNTGTPSTSVLLGYTADFGADVGNVALDLTVNLNAAGIYTGAR